MLNTVKRYTVRDSVAFVPVDKDKTHLAVHIIATEQRRVSAVKVTIVNERLPLVERADPHRAHMGVVMGTDHLGTQYRQAGSVDGKPQAGDTGVAGGCRRSAGGCRRCVGGFIRYYQGNLRQIDNILITIIDLRPNN